MKKILLQGVILLIFVQPLQLHSQEIHVSPLGSDRNPGTQMKPLATPEAARDLLRKLRIGKPGQHKTARIIMHAGTYDLKSSFVLDERDGGTKTNPVQWSAAANEDVILSGGKTIPSNLFKPISNPAISKKLGSNVASQVMELDIRQAGITNTGKHRQYGHGLPVVPSTMELYFNHEPMILARYPNKGDIKIGKVVDKGSVPRVGDKSNRGAVFNYTDDRHKRWAGQSNIWIQGTLNYGFADDYNSIEKIDTTNKTVKLGKPHLYGVGAGSDFQSYVAINILEELDEPGEWFLDETSGKLYLWPPAQLKDADIKVSILEDPIVALEGVNHLRFYGMKIEAGRGIGLYMENCTYTTVAGCIIRNVGTTGIVMGQGAQLLDENSSVDDYVGIPVSRQVGSFQNHIYRNTTWNRNAGHHNRILSCDIYNTGSGGVMLSGGDKKTLTPGNNTVENCRISLYNRRNKFTFAGIRVDGVGNRIVHNEIFNSDWHGIFVHGNEHVFEYNHIHDVTLNSNDTSPWYIGRNPSDRGNIVRYNFFDHCGNKNRMNMGIYCDDSSADVFIYGNVFNDMLTDHGVLFSNTGWHLVMKNNIIINPLAHTAVTSANYYTWAAPQAVEMFGDSGLIRKRLTKEIDFRSPPYSTKYPALLPYLDAITPGKEWQSMRARGNVLEGNLIIGGPENPIKLLGGEHAQMDGRNNWVTKEDPGFVHMANKNFALKPDAKVFQMISGFEPIPFSKMGIYKDQYRK
jgi:Right handed beta helix region